MVGPAIGDDEFLTYGYAGEDELGVGLLTAKGENREGVWTNVGAEKTSMETWTRK